MVVKVPQIHKLMQFIQRALLRKLFGDYEKKIEENDGAKKQILEGLKFTFFITWNKGWLYSTYIHKGIVFYFAY